MLYLDLGNFPQKGSSFSKSSPSRNVGVRQLEKREGVNGWVWFAQCPRVSSILTYRARCLLPKLCFPTPPSVAPQEPPGVWRLGWNMTHVLPPRIMGFFIATSLTAFTKTSAHRPAAFLSTVVSSSPTSRPPSVISLPNRYWQLIVWEMSVMLYYGFLGCALLWHLLLNLS